LDVKKPKQTEVRPSLAATATHAPVRPTYVPVRPGALKLNSKDVMNKDAIKKRLEIQKQKQLLRQRQIQEQKVTFHHILNYISHILAQYWLHFYCNRFVFPG